MLNSIRRTLKTFAFVDRNNYTPYLNLVSALNLNGNKYTSLEVHSEVPSKCNDNTLKNVQTLILKTLPLNMIDTNEKTLFFSNLQNIPIASISAMNIVHPYLHTFIVDNNIVNDYIPNELKYNILFRQKYYASNNYYYYGLDNIHKFIEPLYLNSKDKIFAIDDWKLQEKRPVHISLNLKSFSNDDFPFNTSRNGLDFDETLKLFKQYNVVSLDILNYTENENITDNYKSRQSIYKIIKAFDKDHKF